MSAHVYRVLCADCVDNRGGLQFFGCESMKIIRFVLRREYWRYGRSVCPQLYEAGVEAEDEIEEGGATTARTRKARQRARALLRELPHRPMTASGWLRGGCAVKRQWRATDDNGAVVLSTS